MLRDQLARITSPATGSLIALNLDILPSCQRVSFSIEGGKFHWLTNGKVFVQGSAAQWLPWPGRLVGAGGA